MGIMSLAKPTNLILKQGERMRCGIQLWISCDIIALCREDTVSTKAARDLSVTLLDQSC